ncbi:MAG: two pore domain potassium channel family protein [Bacteroidales bacterium]|nr:two pore domain potassium channel family protein [Bacteroidales bacterium]
MGNKPRIFKHGHNFYLLFALLIQITIYPLFSNEETRFMFSDLFSTVILIAGIYAIDMKKNQKIIAISIGSFAFLGIWYSIIIEERIHLEIFSIICQIAFYIYVIVVILKNLIKAKDVNANIMCGAIVVYLLIGMSFALFYSLIEGLSPCSFSIASSESFDLKLNVFDFMYYSFTTLTTTGYGDITAVSLQARAASNIEQITGVMYVAIIISRFVSIYILTISNKKSK